MASQVVLLRPRGPHHWFSANQGLRYSLDPEELGYTGHLGRDEASRDVPNND